MLNLTFLTKIRSGCCKVRDQVPLLGRRGFPLGANSRLYSACVCSNILLKRKMRSDYTGMMQGWLDGCATLGARIGFLQRNFGQDQD